MFFPWIRPSRSQPVAPRPRPSRRVRSFFLPQIERLEERTLLSIAPLGTGRFDQAVHFAVGTDAGTPAVADFNRDGALDVIVPNATDNTLSVLLGNNQGSFRSLGTIPVSASPRSVVAGDFNRDGKVDLAVMCYDAGVVNILLGNGDGTFAVGASLTAGKGPREAAVADFNGDGNPDLAVANLGASSVSVLLGNGNGTFKNTTNFNVGVGPRGVTAADFNGDGKIDLAVPNSNDGTVKVLLGNGNGTFKTATSYAVGSSPVTAAVADINGDHILDLIVANGASNTLSLLLGNGNGTFRSGGTLTTGGAPRYVVAADFNLDGAIDLVVTNSGANTIGSYLGNGDGTFQAATTFATNTNPIAAVVADFNGDGLLDVVVADKLSNTVSLLPQLRNAAVSLQVLGPTGSVTAGNAAAITVSALTSNGQVDSRYPATVQVSSNTGAFAPFSYTFTTADMGVHTFSLTLTQAGSPRITVTDAANGTLTGAATVSVIPAAASSLSLSGFPTGITAGASSSVTVTAFDSFGNTATGYTGTVHFTSSDNQAVLPADAPLSAGSGTFTVTLRTAGTRSVTVSDRVAGSLTASITGIAVNAAAASQLVFAQQPTETGAGLVINPGLGVTVAVFDPFGNAAFALGPITLSLGSNPGNAILLGTLSVSAVNGRATFTDLAVTRTGIGYALTATGSGLSSFASNSFTIDPNAPPVLSFVSGPATSVTGTNAVVSAGATDPDDPTSSLVYSWAESSGPSGGARFDSTNGTTAAGNITATFTQSGSYTLTVTVIDPTGASVSGNVTVMVAQTPTSLAVLPGQSSVVTLATQRFTAQELDQFGLALAIQPPVTWSVDNLLGQIDATGLYTAPAANPGGQTALVRATDSTSSLSGMANVTVTAPPPVFTASPSANPGQVTGAFTRLHVGAIDGNSSTSDLSFVWTVTLRPTGAALPALTNEVYNLTAGTDDITATFSQAGSYSFTVTVMNPSGAAITGHVDVSVVQTPNSLTMTRTSMTVNTGGTVQFAAQEFDQFGMGLTVPPTFTWALTPGSVGSISGTGLYTAPNTTAVGASASITVIDPASGLGGVGGVAVLDQPPQITNPVAANPGAVSGTSTRLTVGAADADDNFGDLSFTWTVTSRPTGAPLPQFTAEARDAHAGTDSITAIFSQAGSYTFLVTVADPRSGSNVASSVTVTVTQTLTTIALSPATSVVTVNTTQQFSATLLDQFGLALSNPPAVTWSVSQGSGTISGTGLYTAPATNNGSVTIQAGAGGMTSTSAVSLNTPPTIYFLKTSGFSGPLTSTLLALDNENNPLTFRVTGAPSRGTVVVQGNQFIYTATRAFVGSDTITYVANDGYADSTPATISINYSAAFAGGSIVSLNFGGYTRSYVLDVPTNLNLNQPAPLIVFLGGSGSNGVQISTQFGISGYANSSGFVAVCPDALINRWADGAGKSPTDQLGIDDVGFINTLINDVASRIAIDPNRIYVIGHSEGGIMSERLGLALSNRLAGIGAIAGPISANQRDVPLAGFPLSVVYIHGTADTITPYNGGNTSDGATESATSNVSFWNSWNGITGAATITQLPNINTTDSSTVELDDYAGGIGGTEVAFYKVIGGGHNCPGYPSAGSFGPTNLDINGITTAITFLLAHPRGTGALPRVVIGPDDAVRFGVTTSGSAAAGSPVTITVTAQDANGRTVAYLGTVSFASSDALAVLPANYTFTSADAGVHTFTVIFQTNATQTVTASDTLYAPLSGQAIATILATGNQNSFLRGSRYFRLPVQPFLLTAPSFLPALTTNKNAGIPEATVVDPFSESMPTNPFGTFSGSDHRGTQTGADGWFNAQMLSILASAVATAEPASQQLASPAVDPTNGAHHRLLADWYFAYGWDLSVLGED